MELLTTQKDVSLEGSGESQVQSRGSAQHSMEAGRRFKKG